MENNEVPNIEIDIKGIQCDNPKCSYSDMDIQVSQYTEYINKPCPLCGENLLTQESYDSVMAWIESAKIANQFSAEELKNIVTSMSPDEVDVALDNINALGLKKIEILEDGREHWTTKRQDVP